MRIGRFSVGGLLFVATMVGRLEQPVQGSASELVATQVCSQTRSIGLPWKGALQCGQSLLPSKRVRMLTSVCFGTTETLKAINLVADFLDSKDPTGPPLEVLDISREEGGPMPESHLSHQSGRDVDFSYFYKEKFYPHPAYAAIPCEAMDAARSWLLIEGLIRTKQVQRILIDYEVQKVLYEEASRHSFTKWKQLFQYPHGPKKRIGLIRHYPNHLSHLHVRFKCPKGHRFCRG